MAFGNHGPDKPEWHDHSGFFSHFLVDDQVLVEPDLGVRRWMAGRLADKLCRWLLGDAAINPEKNAEEGGWDLHKICWGLLYKTDQATVTLPEAKLLKAYHLLHDSAFDPGVRTLPLKLAMQLRGNAEYWGLVCPSFAPELAVMNKILSALVGVHEHTAATKPEDTWFEWKETIELSRILVSRTDL